MIRIFLILVTISLLSACKRDNTPDVSGIDADVKILRTENEIFNMREFKDIDNLIKSHPAFYQLYFKEILMFPNDKNQDSIYKSLQMFVKDSLVTDLFEKVKNKYSDMSALKDQTDLMYRYLLYYFPNRTTIPNLYTFISEFGYQIFIFQDDGGKDGIGIGLDMFLHPEINYKMIDPDNSNFSDYITRTWNKDHLVKKIADLHVADIVGEAPGHRLIDQMIHNGKMLYITDLLLPSVHDSIIVEYTGKQLEWCQENELQMWSFFFDQKLFYESNPAKISKYINPSPKSPDMPDEAPGRTANYIGWQIVKTYMERFPSTTVNDLIDLKDSQMIMEKSKYKPKQK